MYYFKVFCVISLSGLIAASLDPPEFVLTVYATFEMLKVQEIAINQSKFSQFFSLLVNGAKAARIKNTKKNILRQFYKT